MSNTLPSTIKKITRRFSLNISVPDGIRAPPLKRSQLIYKKKFYKLILYQSYKSVFPMDPVKIHPAVSKRQTIIQSINNNWYQLYLGDNENVVRISSHEYMLEVWQIEKDTSYGCVATNRAGESDKAMCEIVITKRGTELNQNFCQLYFPIVLFVPIFAL